MNQEPIIDRRSFLKLAAYGAAVCAGFSIPGCAEPPADARGKLYFNRRNDLLDTLSKCDAGGRAIGKAIISAADKLARSLQPDYLSFPSIAETPAEPKRREEKKSLGVLEIYNVTSNGISVLETYWSDLMTNSLMANITIGENFRVAERYRLSTLLHEYDVRKLKEFDPREAIKAGLFTGANAVLTGNLYPSSSVYRIDSNGFRHTDYEGGIDVVLRLIDVTAADLVGSATEHIKMNAVVEQWVDRNINRR